MTRLVSLYISLHAMFQNLVTLIITSGKTMWGYQELQVSYKLVHGPRHYNYLSSRVRAPTSMYWYWAVLADAR